MEEIWKTIWNDTVFEVSNLGRVRNTKTGNVLKGSKGYAGHIFVCMSKKKQYFVHRLVFEAFYRRLLPNEFVHHLNEVKSCNIWTNLVAWDKSRHTHFHNEQRTEETNSIVSSKIKALWKTEQYRKKRRNNSNVLKKLWKNEQWRAKMLQARKRALQQQ